MCVRCGGNLFHGKTPYMNSHELRLSELRYTDLEYLLISQSGVHYRRAAKQFVTIILQADHQLESLENYLSFADEGDNYLIEASSNYRYLEKIFSPERCFRITSSTLSDLAYSLADPTRR